MRALTARGVPVGSTLVGTGVAPSLFEDPDNRIPHVVAMKLLERAVDLTKDPALGVHAAALIRPGDFDALEYVARASGNLRSALQAVSRYVRLMHDATTFVHGADGGNDESWTLTVSPPAPRASVEFAVATLVVAGRLVTGRDEAPKEVLFSHEAPADKAPYEEVLRCAVRWGAARTALVFDAEQLERPFSHTSPVLSATLEQHAERLLAELSSSRTYATRVREHLVASLQAGETSAASVARRLRASERTLRRRLQDEGVAFSDLLADVRRELAVRYLDEPGLSVDEIAFLLGFSTGSAFRRAFRRWTGATPSEHRDGAGKAVSRARDG